MTIYDNTTEKIWDAFDRNIETEIKKNHDKTIFSCLLYLAHNRMWNCQRNSTKTKTLETKNDQQILHNIWSINKGQNSKEDSSPLYQIYTL